MRYICLGALAAMMLCAPLYFVRTQAKLFLVNGTTYDFGDVFTPSLERFLTLRNVGTDTLTISSVSTSCGCTAALMSNDRIAPRDSGILSVKFDAKRYSGKVSKAISFHTNDQSQKSVNINFTVNVIKSLTFDPEYFFFSTTVDSVDEKTLTITNSSPQTIHIHTVKPSSNFISLKLSEYEIRPAEEITLTGVIRPTTAGTVRGNVEITTDFASYPTFTVKYFAYTKEKKTRTN